jgi:lipid-binding SYLF domain-containing protein
MTIISFWRIQMFRITRSNARPAAVLATVAMLTAMLAGCAATPSDSVRIADSRAALVRFVDRDPNLQEWVNHAHGYAVFPSVGKAGLGIGGSYGNGIVFERSQPVGTASMIQGTIGLQIGAQNFSQVIFFQDEAALRTFQRGNFEFSAQATAVVVSAGASASTSYEKGVAVFILARGGLMAEASLGGQKFEYQPL